MDPAPTSDTFGIALCGNLLELDSIAYVDPVTQAVCPTCMTALLRHANPAPDGSSPAVGPYWVILVREPIHCGARLREGESV